MPGQAHPLFVSDPLRPAAGLVQRLACFEEALEAGQDHRPSIRRRLDQLRVGFIHLMDHGELDRVAPFFEFVGQA